MHPSTGRCPSHQQATLVQEVPSQEEPPTFPPVSSHDQGLSPTGLLVRDPNVTHPSMLWDLALLLPLLRAFTLRHLEQNSGIFSGEHSFTAIAAIAPTGQKGTEAATGLRDGSLSPGSDTTHHG